MRKRDLTFFFISNSGSAQEEDVMNSRPQVEQAMSSRLSGLQISSNQSSGLYRAKATPPVLKTHSGTSQKATKFIPHPPHRPVGIQRTPTRMEGKGVKPPLPPSEPKSRKTAVRKFYDIKKQENIIDEGRVSGDGMSSTITVPISVTCQKNMKFGILGQNHF